MTPIYTRQVCHDTPPTNGEIALKTPRPPLLLDSKLFPSTIVQRNIMERMWRHVWKRWPVAKIRVLHAQIPKQSSIDILRVVPEGSILSPRERGIQGDLCWVALTKQSVCFHKVGWCGICTKSADPAVYLAKLTAVRGAEMVLTTWCTILLGVAFEIYSDYNSLK